MPKLALDFPSLKFFAARLRTLTTKTATFLLGPTFNENFFPMKLPRGDRVVRAHPAEFRALDSRNRT